MRKGAARKNWVKGCVDMTARDFNTETEISNQSRIFSIEAGRVEVADEGIIATATFSGVDLGGIVREVFTKQDIELIFARKPRVYTGEKWTEDSKIRINKALSTWPAMPQGAFSRDDLAPIFTARQRLMKLQPCYSYEHLLNHAHYKKGLSWAKSASYAKWARCSCCKV